MIKVKHEIMKDGLVAAGSTQVDMTPIIPIGKIILLKRFGGCSGITAGFCAVQFGDSVGGWTTIRALTDTYEFPIGTEFIGNGVKRFRIIRQNDSTAAKYMSAYLEALVLN